MDRRTEARALAKAHPELWGEAPGVAAFLCAQAADEDRPALAAALEEVLVQLAGPNHALTQCLGGLYAAWATAELEAPATAAAGTTHLARAHELQPDNFALASQLARLYLGNKQPARAAAALHEFISADALPEERQKAEQILAGR